MENISIFDDESDHDRDADLVSIYLLTQIRKHKPEWFEESPHPQKTKKRRKKLNLKGKFNFITTKNNNFSWEDNLPDFVAFEKNTRVYQ